MRGKLSDQAFFAVKLGLIPACAGKTFHGCWGEGGLAAHPRVCGENLEFHTRVGDEQGSSPRVRGKHLSAWRRSYLNRLIPACAGKTARFARWVQVEPAHPRVCGENVSSSAFAPWYKGSSPRVRGKRIRHNLDY